MGAPGIEPTRASERPPSSREGELPIARPVSTGSVEGENVIEAPASRKRGSRFALIAGYVVTGLLFVGATGLRWQAVLAGLVGGLVVRTIYVGIRNRNGGSRPILSPWTVLIAAFFAASALGSLRSSEQDDADAFVASMCFDGSMQAFDAQSPAEQRFSRPDFEKFLSRYCDEAVSRGLVSNTELPSPTALEDLRESIIDSMVASGEIRER